MPGPDFIVGMAWLGYTSCMKSLQVKLAVCLLKKPQHQYRVPLERCG